MMTNEEILDATFDLEGGYSNRKHDGGGPTKFGITGRVLRSWRRDEGGFVPNGAEEIRIAVEALTKKEARAIYINRFIEKPRFGDIADGNLKHLVVDMGILHGRHRTSRWLQRILKVKVDGITGSRTIAAINTKDERETKEVYKRLLARRYRGFAEFTKFDPNQLVNLVGWINRANRFLSPL